MAMFGVSEKISLTASIVVFFLSFVGALMAKVDFGKIIVRSFAAALFFGLFTYLLVRVAFRYFPSLESEAEEEEEETQEKEEIEHVEALSHETHLDASKREKETKNERVLDQPSLAQQIVDDFSSEQLSAAVRQALKEEK